MSRSYVTAAAVSLDCQACAAPMIRCGDRYWFCLTCRTFLIRRVMRVLKPGEGFCV